VAALKSAGFEVNSTPEGNLVATRGSLARTLLLGAMAGKGFQVTFPVAFYSDPVGNLLIRVSRQLGSGALKGGVIGANMTNNAFVATSTQIAEHFTATGILVSSVTHA
jgi:hypothetical protein